ncbi:hypothetical protein MTW97_07135 [Mammaliicoccus sciuri]|uniref:hypothetical protein n=1 Tax=Mammaliicoccus sciuri TaxID=1296 RepID=UPI001FB2E1E9|nr:hypothetical protein [Mammaliicoccus sciuri]MCJ0922436.1 hypothetical protein [Mammaliicoccus sciuri]MCJ0925080.1 hypothetical protein [Mammaliicoccus sciuri]
MENIYKVILLASTLITLIYNFIKWIVKKRNREENSTINIWMESISLSFIISILFIAILYFKYIFNKLIGVRNANLINETFFILSIVAIFIGFITFVIKDRYKDKYGDVIFQDIQKYKKERLNAYQKINKMQQEIGKRVIENDFTYEVKLNYINDKYKSLPELHPITRKYNIICIVNWMCIGTINIALVFAIFDSSNNVTMIIGSLLIIFLIFIVNTINIYSDLRIKYGKVNSTLNKIEKHQSVYKKLFDKNNIKDENKNDVKKSNQ